MKEICQHCSSRPNCKKLMCKMTEKVLLAQRQDFQEIIRQKVFANTQKISWVFFFISVFFTVNLFKKS